MDIVAIKIMFTTPCLGARKVANTRRCAFERSGKHVIFMPTWWREILEYGAMAATPSFSVELARRVTFAPTVDGQPKTYRRHYIFHGERGFKDHEAFVAGQVIGVRAMLPDGMGREDIERILETAGPFKGISPYGRDTQGFGRFEVLEVQPVRSQAGSHIEGRDERADPPQRESSGDNTSGG